MRLFIFFNNSKYDVRNAQLFAADRDYFYRGPDNTIDIVEYKYLIDFRLRCVFCTVSYDEIVLWLIFCLLRIPIKWFTMKRLDGIVVGYI